jgi:CxxC-x17-CxxC domain-containing protein
MSYADKVLACRECGARFVFTAGEQEFYAQKGFGNAPTRCASCRQAYKKTMQTTSRSVGATQPNAKRTAHRVACSACGKQTLVPFVPRSNKPIYCDSCFQQQRSKRW